MRTRAPSCLRLFFEMFLIASLVLGGGYAILAAAENRFARKLGWLREGELLGMIPIFSLVPGIIAGHTAVFLGSRLAGLRGSLAALAGTVLPSILVFTAVSAGYDLIPVDDPHLAAAFRGLRAALAGVLLATTVRGWRTSVRGAFGCTLFAAALALLLAGASPFTVILGGMGLGIATTVVRDRAGHPPQTRVYRSFWMIPILFLGYGLIAFGGGYALVPVYLRDFVGTAAPHLQLDPHDFANVMALTQMTPGPIGINCATYFGYRLGGIAGGVIATVALILPGFLILRLALTSLERFRGNVLVRGIFLGTGPVTRALLTATTFVFLRLAVWPDGFAHPPRTVESILVVLSTLALLTRRLGVVPTILLSAAVTLLLGIHSV